MMIQDRLFLLALADSFPADMLALSDRQDACRILLNLGEASPGARLLFLSLEPGFWEVCPFCTPQTLQASVGLQTAPSCLSRQNAQKIHTLFSKISSEYQTNSPAYSFFKYSWISELLLNITDLSVPSEKKEVSESVIEEIIRFLEKNYTQKISIDMLSEKFFISKYHLMRQFKKATGCTIHNFILNKRIYQACALIKSKKTPSEACYLSGFTDYSLFFKTFTKITGLSPSQYPKEVSC